MVHVGLTLATAGARPAQPPKGKEPRGWQARGHWDGNVRMEGPNLWEFEKVPCGQTIKYMASCCWENCCLAAP